MLEDKLNERQRDRFSKIPGSFLGRRIMPLILAGSTMIAPAYAAPETADMPLHLGGYQTFNIDDLQSLFPEQKMFEFSLIAPEGSDNPNSMNYVSVDNDYSTFSQKLAGMAKKKLKLRDYASQIGIPGDGWRYVDDKDVQKELVESAKTSIIDSAKKYKLDPVDIERIIRHESGGNPYAISKAYSLGMMQLQPCVYCDSEFGPAINPFLIDMSIDRGAAVFSRYLNISRGLVKRNPWAAEKYEAKDLALIAYNIGLTAMMDAVAAENTGILDAKKAEYSDKVLGMRPWLKYAMAR